MLAAVVCILLLSLGASGEDVNVNASSPTTLRNRTWDQFKEIATSVREDGYKQISDFRNAFMGYEKRIKIFIDNTRRGFMLINTDNEFLRELKGYMEKLPNKTRPVTTKFRSKCYCEGQIRTPCPDRCMDSCYDRYYSRHHDNCTRYGIPSNCYCYEGSNTICNSGMHSCYEEKTEQIPIDNKCLNFSNEQSMMEESFLRFSDLLLEPLKIQVRDLEFQITSFKQALIATDLISNITSQMREEEKPTWFPEAKKLLDEKLQFFKQRKRNITLQMLNIQEQAEIVSKNIHVLKEQTFAQISQTIRKYTCCLKSFNFTVKDNDCDTKPAATLSNCYRSFVDQSDYNTAVYYQGEPQHRLS